MSTDFLHGVEFIELDEGGRPIKVVRSSVIGIVGTAPKADTNAFPLNKPVLISGDPKEAAKLDLEGKGAGTLPNALDAIFDQHHGLVVVVRVEEKTKDDGDGNQVFDCAATTPYVLGEYEDAPPYAGVEALLDAKNTCGVKPKILIAPGFTHEHKWDEKTSSYLKNPVADALDTVARKLRAIAIVDSPLPGIDPTDTEDPPRKEDAKTVAIKDAELYGSPRVYSVTPFVKVYRNTEYVDEPASARVAGVIARTDAEKGFWWSPSNKEILGIVGLARPVPFEFGDHECEANLLNDSKVATIIREDGFRLWGNRTCSSDQRWAFLSTRRIADMINESIQQAHLWAVDRPIGRSYFEAVCESVNQFLRTLTQKGAILGGECWVDEELNSPSEVEQGNVYFDFDFTPAYTAEHITFRSRMTNGYVEEVFK